MFKELAMMLHEVFGTDQSYHLRQQPDGTYKKMPGAITPVYLESILQQGGSVGVYQQNMDYTIKWICFDFDILKVHLNSDLREKAQEELEIAVNFFCTSLDNLSIPYLIEFSGNRGFHVWITFSEKINFRTGYEIRQALMEKIELNFNKKLIAIDYFPASGTPTQSVGMGVKIPFSKHTRTNEYSLLLESQEKIKSTPKTSTLDEPVVRKGAELLNAHKHTTKSELEVALDTVFQLSQDEINCPRVKKIIIHNNGFTIEELIKHWNKHPALKDFSKRIFELGEITHEERRILVGIFHGVSTGDKNNFGHKILHKIFKYAKNYNYEITDRAINQLSSFYFPIQDQIESAAKSKFQKRLTTEDLLSACIPKFLEYIDGTFEISKQDIEIVKASELSYLYLNDEAQSKIIINDLSCIDSYRLLKKVNALIENPKTAEFYKHLRNEKSQEKVKQRTLVTLKSTERLLTSFILKQLVYFLDMPPSGNSHGYKPNKGFKDGYIFKPWLYLWIKFISNISEAIEDRDNGEYYIVKADVKGFYDSIPHDNLKRLLLGDTAPKINEKFESLSNHSKQLYKNYIDILFQITEKTVGSNTGLPQGPAYARYLAEIYLDNIDKTFDKKIQDFELRLYQRYVDDIFFIANTEEEAKSNLKKLEYELGLLGLTINQEKTRITKIKSFSEDFNEYRSQSKYAVDKVSKNFADATETQKNLAIAEFIKLVQADSANKDLAFIFSHLDGVDQLNSLKLEKVGPTLQSHTGRGSLFKHLFNFILESPENWTELYKLEKFDPLQSEVLTSSFVHVMESNPLLLEGLKKLALDIRDRLTDTDLTNENLAYLILAFGIELDVETVPPEAFINCIVSLPNFENVKDIYISDSLIAYLNISHNQTKDLSDFVESIYPLCASSKTTKDGINRLAKTFFAKMNNDMKNGTFSAANKLTSPSAASKYYYLLCLFSASKSNLSRELLETLWMYGAQAFNKYDSISTYAYPDWFKKISDIEYTEEYALLIVSSIADGNIFRGAEDKHKIFEKFHSLFLIYISFVGVNIDHTKIDAEIEKLKGKANFYRWLIEENRPDLFPTTNRLWFEKNLIENSSIMLKKGTSVLIRKPTSQFNQSNTPINELNGFSEIIIDYDASKLVSINDYLDGLRLNERLERLVDTIKLFNGNVTYPNFFCSERLINSSAGTPFTNELGNLKNLLFETSSENVEVLENTKNNFIKCYLRSASNNNEKIQLIKEKYIDNLDGNFDLEEFVVNLSLQLKHVGDLEDTFHIDMSVAAALYSSIDIKEPVNKISVFVDQYHKFNKDDSNRHAYAVDENTLITDDTPSHLLDTISQSLKVIPTKIIQPLGLYLHNDIEDYRKRIIQVLESQDADDLNIFDFRRVVPSLLLTAEALKINDQEYSFQSVNLINITRSTIVPLELRNVIIIQSSEHVYACERNEKLYILAMHEAMSKMYRSIKVRHHDQSVIKLIRSYPATHFDRQKIISINRFNIAVEVISQHRELTKAEATDILVNWLIGLPVKFHQPIVALLSAHECMQEPDVSAFLSMVNKLLRDSDSNPFLIKRMEDHNGTHRILYKDSNLGRLAAQFSPINIKDGAKRATIIVDILISGSQIAKVIGHYTKKDIDSSRYAKYFNFSEAEQISLQQKLGNLEEINICTVLYTDAGVQKVINAVHEFINPSTQVNVICGRNLGENAFFESTKKLGEKEKSDIRNLLLNSDDMRALYSQLQSKFKPLSPEEINKTNLVTRVLSLPKKHFSFLNEPLRRDSTCRPLVRITELNE